MTEQVVKLKKKVRVLTQQKYKDRKKLETIAKHVKQIYNITSQLGRQGK